MKIGSIQLKNPLVLAPMAGVTDSVFRGICAAYGASLTFTEMVSAKSLMYENKNTQLLLYNQDASVPCGVQLFGHEPDIMAGQAASAELAEYPLLDINMGCPAHKITANGEGSALLKKPELAYEIMRQVVLAAKVPVTVKIRSGWDANSINAPQMAYLAQKAGISAITVHGRTAEMGYSGRADLSVVREVVRAVTIPVIGNGDVTSGALALEMLETTGCSAVMIGRGAQGCPWVFKQALSAINQTQYAPVSIEERIRVIRTHARGLIKLKGEAVAMKQFRKHLAWYTHGLRGASRIRQNINKLNRYEDIEEVLCMLAPEAY